MNQCGWFVTSHLWWNEMELYENDLTTNANIIVDDLFETIFKPTQKQQQKAPPNSSFNIINSNRNCCYATACNHL